MIPHRLLGNDLLGNGLKQRVTACRKRLRVNRHQNRVHSNEGQLLFTSEANSEIRASYPAESPDVRESLIGGGEASEFQHREAWLRPDQEVGLT